MAKSLEEILFTPHLIGMIENPKGGVPTKLPPEFLRSDPSGRCDGNAATWYEVSGNRQTAQLVHYGAPSVRREVRGASQRTARMIHTHEHFYHNVMTLQRLRAYDRPDVQQLGKQTLKNDVVQHLRLLDNLRKAAACSVLALGHIYFDSSNNLLPSSSGATTDVNFGVPANNLNQWNGIISASWATTTTDIIAHIKNVKSVALRTTGYELTHAFYGANILGYLVGNAGVKELLKTRSDLAGAFKGLEIPDGFLGLKWIPVEGEFYEDANGTNQTWFGGDALTLTPTPSPDWWDILEGSYQAPRQMGRISSDAVDAASDFMTVYGQFNYAKISDDPAGIKHNYGDTMLPCLKVPSAIYIGDVTP